MGTNSPRPEVPRQRRLPSFALYGEHALPGSVLLHVEPIASRSRRYDWEIGAHVHPGLQQVIWLRTGGVDTVLDEWRANGRGPLALVIPPGVAHAFRFEPDSDGCVLTLSAAWLAEGQSPAFGEVMTELFSAPHLIDYSERADEAARLDALFAVLLAEHGFALTAESPVPSWLARAVIWPLAQRVRQASRGRSARGAAMQSGHARWAALLEAHHRDHWPVSRYARQLGLSVERLNRLVRAETGQSAQAACHARLMREASRRLIHLDVPISRLAFDLGFADPAYFCRFFKRNAGVSPRAFRARHRGPSHSPAH